MLRRQYRTDIRDTRMQGVPYHSTHTAPDNQKRQCVNEMEAAVVPLRFLHTALRWRSRK